MSCCHNENREKEINYENEQKQNISKNSFDKNELKIELYPENLPKYNFEKKSIKNILSEKTLAHSLDKNKDLAYLGSNVPLLEGFFISHCNHYPIRIKPDDVWLLIVQAFSHHVNANSEELRHYFVNFEGKKTLTVNYNGIFYIENVDKKILENFAEQINEQMKEYLGEEILQNLTPNFSTTDYNSTIICKLSIMGAFKKYFEYSMNLATCGIPYIILEGNLEDYKSIKEKAKNLSKYDFKWYIDRIIPHIEKMIEAKSGKIDTNYFKNFIQRKVVRDICVSYTYISGWILDFFAYYNNKVRGQIKIEKFNGKSLEIDEFKNLASQILIVPFTIIEEITQKKYDMKYQVGFIGCDQNEKKEVSPVQGWIVSPSSEEERKSIL
jgi:hypothetical protein